MNNTNSKFSEWWAEHKDTVLIIGGVVLVVGVGFAAFKYRKLIAGLIKPASKLIATGAAAAPAVTEAVEVRSAEKADTRPAEEKEENAAIENETVDSGENEIEGYHSTNTDKVTNNGEPYDVSGHIRHLGESRYPSIFKRQEAEANGITLGEHDTLVDRYQKNVGHIDICEQQYA